MAQQLSHGFSSRRLCCCTWHSTYLASTKNAHRHACALSGWAAAYFSIRCKGCMLMLFPPGATGFKQYLSKARKQDRLNTCIEAHLQLLVDLRKVALRAADVASSLGS